MQIGILIGVLVVVGVFIIFKMMSKSNTESEELYDAKLSICMKDENFKKGLAVAKKLEMEDEYLMSFYEHKNENHTGEESLKYALETLKMLSED